MQVVDPCRYMYRGGQPSEVPSNGHDQAVERAARCLLAKLTRGKAKEVTVQGDAAHVLVTTAEARVRCAADHVAIDPGDLAVTSHHGPSTRAENAATAGEDGEVIRVLEVSTPGEVPEVQCSGQIRGRGVSDAPVRVHGIAESSVRDQPVKRGRAFGHSSARLKKDRPPVVPVHVFQDPLSQPFGNDWS